MQQPLVSVIMPAYNCERYIAQAVRSALDQTWSHLEVIVVDDASRDSTYSIVAKMEEEDNRIRLCRNGENQGVARTRNRGIELARGDYIAFLDGDDLWLPDKLERQLALFQAAGCHLCYTAYSFVDEQGCETKRPYPVPESVTFEELLEENVIGLSTVVVLASRLKNHPMRGEYAHEDYVLWLELLRAGCVARGLSQPLMRYRLLQGSRSGDKRRAARNRWRVYRRFLGMSVPAAAAVFARYAVRGIRKHWGG